MVTRPVEEIEAAGDLHQGGAGAALQSGPARLHAEVAHHHLVHAGGQYEDSEVVQDGNIITSRQPDDLPAFCRTIIGALSKD